MHIDFKIQEIFPEKVEKNPMQVWREIFPVF